MMIPPSTPTNAAADLAANQVQRAVEQFQKGAFQECLQTLNQLEGLPYALRGQYLIKAGCLLRIGDLPRALSALQREVALFPNDSKEAQELLAQLANQQPSDSAFPDYQSGGKYLVSGMAPEATGTGRLLRALLPVAQAKGFTTINPSTGSGFSPEQASKIQQIRNSTVLFLHPQTLGFANVLRLIENGNRIGWYVLDNCFFCIESYNYRVGKFGECVDCLGNLGNCHPSCKPMPALISKEDNLRALAALQAHASAIQFFCQNSAQAELVKKHFGAGSKVTVVGMRTDDFKQEPEFCDIVFHAGAHPAKGFEYVYRIAQYLPEHTILMPCSEGYLQQFCGTTTRPPNLIFKDITWDTGLKEQVINCRLVLCPSLWSAPIEGALMKSLYYNGSVAVFNTQYGFQRDIPDELLLRLEADPQTAANAIRDRLSTRPALRDQARDWVKKAYREVNFDRIFQELEQRT